MIAAPILPYVLLAAVSATSVAGLGGYLWGRSDGRALEAGRQAADETLIATVATAAQMAAAREIAGIEIKHTTIRQAVEKEIRENTVYRNAECTHPERVFRDLNAALAGAVPARAGQLSNTLAAGRPELRGHNAEADRPGRPVSPVPGGGAGGER